jgi:hypothetical protein
MANTNDQSGSETAATRKRNATRRSTAGARANAQRTIASTQTAAREASRAVSAESRVRFTQAQQLAERAVLVPVGAGLIARDNLTALASKYRTQASRERELKRYERRGTTAQNHLERQVRRTRTRFERELRQNRRRLEREVRSVRRDFENRSGTLATRVEKLVSGASDRITAS